MHSIIFHVTRAEDGHYVALAQGHKITTTALSFDKLIRNLEEELAVHATRGTTAVPFTLIFADVLRLDLDEEQAPILFPY